MSASQIPSIRGSHVDEGIGRKMREMYVPPFRNKIEILDFENFFKTRLSTQRVMWPEQATSILGYMCYPTDEAARIALIKIIQGWDDRLESHKPTPVPAKVQRIQADWIKVTDIFQCYYDMGKGKHQERRGGPSIGKAVTLVSANAKGRGTGQANLWKVWGDYKDVAHLVTSAALVCAEVRDRFRNITLGPEALSPTQFIPFQMTLLMPDLILAVAKEFEAYGLDVNESRPQSAFDPDTVWRIPADINVVPLPPPIRKLRPQDVVVLNERRAGKRGRTKTTPVSK